MGRSYHPPVKRSVTIAGHPTSISLEPIFWDALEAEAARQALPVNALVARIDVERMEAEEPPNLTSAIRPWLWRRRPDPMADRNSTRLNSSPSSAYRMASFD